MSAAIAPPTVTCRVPGVDRHKQPQGQQEPHQLVQAGTGFDARQRRLGVNRQHTVTGGHVHHDPAAVLRGVAVAAAQPTSEDPSPAGAGDKAAEVCIIPGRMDCGDARVCPSPTRERTAAIHSSSLVGKQD